MARGRRQASALVRGARPELLFATAAEDQALIGRGRPLEDLLSFGPTPLVKRGRAGAFVLVPCG